MRSRLALFLIATLALPQSPTKPAPISLEITGVVLNASGIPIEGAKVEVYSPYFLDTALGAAARNTTTEEFGKFHLAANAPGSYHLTASKNGYLDGSVRFEISSTDKKHEAN